MNVRVKHETIHAQVLSRDNVNVQVKHETIHVRTLGRLTKTPSNSSSKTWDEATEEWEEATYTWASGSNAKQPPTMVRGELLPNVRINNA